MFGWGDVWSIGWDIVLWVMCGDVGSMMWGGVGWGDMLWYEMK